MPAFSVPPPSKSIINLGDIGYTIVPTEAPELAQVYGPTVMDVLNPEGMVVDTFQAIPARNYSDQRPCLVIHTAHNAWDRNRPAHSQLRLREAMLAFWKVQVPSFHVSRLRVFRYSPVIEKSFEDCWAACMDRLGISDNPTQVVRLRKNSSNADERWCFRLIQRDAIFAIGVAKMCREYSEFEGKTIVEYAVQCIINPPGEVPVFRFRWLQLEIIIG